MASSRLGRSVSLPVVKGPCVLLDPMSVSQLQPEPVICIAKTLMGSLLSGEASCALPEKV